MSMSMSIRLLNQNNEILGILYYSLRKTWLSTFQKSNQISKTKTIQTKSKKNIKYANA